VPAEGGAASGGTRFGSVDADFATDRIGETVGAAFEVITGGAGVAAAHRGMRLLVGANLAIDADQFGDTLLVFLAQLGAFAG